MTCSFGKRGFTVGEEYFCPIVSRHSLTQQQSHSLDLLVGVLSVHPN